MNIFKAATDPLVNLFKTKSELEAQITRIKTEIVEAEGALSACAELERTIPDRIAEVRSRIVLQRVTDEIINVCPDLVREAKIVRAYERLQADLPAVRAYWEKRLSALAA